MTTFKKHISFPSIEKFSTVVANVNRRNNFIGLDENGEAIYDPSRPKPIIRFKGSVKLHGCFEKDSLVTLANGEEIPISDVNVGDYVLSYNIETESLVEKEVYHIENGVSDKKWVKLYFDDNSHVECTEDHKFYTKNRGWVEAKDLTEEDIFLEKNKV
jgi:hypothetical protein